MGKWKVVHIFSRFVPNEGKVLKLGESETQLFSDLNKSKDFYKKNVCGKVTVISYTYLFKKTSEFRPDLKLSNSNFPSFLQFCLEPSWFHS